MFKKILFILLATITIVYASPKSLTSVTELYIATFDRAPDSNGLKYWVDTSMLDLEGVAESFFDQDEIKKKYPNSMTQEEFINNIYANLFKRSPDKEGFDYWLDELTNNPNIHRSIFILALINGATSEDSKLLTNKTTVGLSFAKDGRANLSEAIDIMNYVTSDSASVDEALSRYNIKSSSRYTFVMIHFEAGYKGRLDNDLPIDMPQEYMSMNLGWQEYLFDTAKKLVLKADSYGFHLTLAFNPQWAEYILLDSDKIATINKWQESGHEIAFHHHSINHPDWNGYSNSPTAIDNQIPFLGNVDMGLDFVKFLAKPMDVTTAMIGGLPTDMPTSYKDTTKDLIFTSGSQYTSFEEYGDIRSLKPYNVIKNNGAKITYLTHRELTNGLKSLTINEALEIFKTEYTSIEEDEVYGVVFHCFDYYKSEEVYNSWFEFIKNSGDTVRSTSEVILDYKYDIETQ